jgi:pimeloyl-ACP methyl ester carboxylesterase
MRRAIAFVLAGVGLFGGAAWVWVRCRLRGVPKPVTGFFSNGMAYARLGTGPRTALTIRGGPGNVVPMGQLFLASSVSILRPFLDSGYTMWVVTRKRDMPEGYRIEDMAEDYATLIADEFSGKVELVIGEEPYGGMIGFCLAARHADRFDHLAVLLAATAMSEEGKELDLGFARLMSEHRTGEAGALLVRFMLPKLRLPGIDRVLGTALVSFAFGRLHPYFASDVLVEAKAVAAFDGTPVLPQIATPVLLIGCDQDAAFSQETYEETARLIPDCTLRMYEGKTAFQAITDSRIATDVLGFVQQRSMAQTA